MWASGAGSWGGVFILGEEVWRKATMERHLWLGVGVSTADCGGSSVARRILAANAAPLAADGVLGGGTKRGMLNIARSW